MQGSHPPEQTPVVLVHGWLSRGRSLRFLARHLQRNGWPDSHVLPIDFRDSCGSNIEHAAEIDAAIETLRSRTGAAEVDVVAHSMGGLALRWYFACRSRSLPPPVRRAVFIATPHRGTWLSLLAWGKGAPEMRPGSKFLRRLETHDLPDSVQTFTVRTVIETHVIPWHSATWPAAHADHVVPLAPHGFMLRSRAVSSTVQRFLETAAHPSPREIARATP
jgi:triacylglycerol lipase